MKNLFITRHAESEAALPQGNDHGRRLTPTGVQQARSQGQRLKSLGNPLQGIVSSSAVRAIETANQLVEGAGWTVHVESADSLYNASAEGLLRFVQRLPEDFDTIMLVGHLPGVAQLLSLFASDHRDLFVAFEPGAMAGLQIDVMTWLEAGPGHGILRWFWPPLDTMS